MSLTPPTQPPPTPTPTPTQGSATATPQATGSFGATASFLSLLKDVTVMQFVGDYKDATEWNAQVGHVSAAGREAVRTHVPYFAHHLRDARQDASRYERYVSAFNEAITYNLNPNGGTDWAFMSDGSRRFILMQRILEEACTHLPSASRATPPIALEDFSEVLAALLAGPEANRTAFQLAMMHQTAARDSEGTRRSGLGRCVAAAPMAIEEIRERLFRPLAAHLDRGIRAVLGL